MIRKLLLSLTFYSLLHAESATVVPLPIMRALVEAKAFIKTDASWMPANDNDSQRYFLDNFYTHNRSLSLFGDKELEAWASRDINYLNSIAKARGFDIQLEPLQTPEGFGVLSILDVTLRWLKEGIKTALEYNGKSYSAVKLEKCRTYLTGCHIGQFLHEHPIVEVFTQGPDTAWMTIADEPLKGFALVEKIKRVQKDLQSAVSMPTDLIFPVVQLNQQENIGWLSGMKLPFFPNHYCVDQALQQTKLSMDEVGAHVESAVMIGICTSCGHEPEPIVIDKPFYLWIERQGCPVPILYAYIDADCWEPWESGNAPDPV